MTGNGNGSDRLSIEFSLGFQFVYIHQKYIVDKPKKSHVEQHMISFHLADEFRITKIHHVICPVYATG
jgi:hypothetical protein